MNMTEGEIVREYKAAANPGEQIQILADENECDVATIKMILFNNGCKEVVAHKKKQGRPPKSTYDTDLTPKDETVYHEDENPYCKVEVEVENEPTETVEEEPKKLEIPQTIINAVQEKLDAVNKTIYDMIDDMGKLFKIRTEITAWLDEVKNL